MKRRKSKQANAREFNQAVREEIYTRDKGECIFCVIEYRMEKSTWYGRKLKSIMHYVPRAANGLGIPENGAVGCQYHHEMLDNGYNKGDREEMMQIFKEYLQSKYPNWDEKKLVYNKWSFLEETR